MIKKSVRIGAASACVFAMALPAQACPFDHLFGGHGHFDHYYYQDQPPEQDAENNNRETSASSEANAPRALPSFAKRDYLQVRALRREPSSETALGSEEESRDSATAVTQYSLERPVQDAMVETPAVD